MQASGDNLFPVLDADDNDVGVVEVDSLCMNCHEQVCYIHMYRIIDIILVLNCDI